MTVAELAAHDHNLKNKVPVYSDRYTGNFTFHRVGHNLYQRGQEPDISMGTAGESQPFNVMQPTSFINVMIKL